MTKTQKRPMVGDRTWFVDWCAGIPTDEFGDSDMDNADERRERRATHDEAVARAKEVLPLDAFGSVTICEAIYEPYDEADAILYPHAGFWECVESTVEVFD